MNILFCRTHAHDLPLPTYQSVGASGLDIHACLAETLLLHPSQRSLISTGFSVAIPEGYELQVRPRSGWAWQYGITILNSPGTIDSDYRGEIKIMLINHSQETVAISPGQRIAQLVLQKCERASVCEVASLDSSDRGHGGFGSTGSR